MLKFVSIGKAFSKNQLLKEGFNDIDLSILINNLLKENLLNLIDDDLFILCDVNLLNIFFREIYG